MTENNKSKFDFDEIVIINSPATDIFRFNQKKGKIIGKSYNDKAIWNYAVLLLELQEVYCFDEIELQATGEFAPKDLYDEADRVTVVVDKNGKGEIKK